MQINTLTANLAIGEPSCAAPLSADDLATTAASNATNAATIAAAADRLGIIPDIEHTTDWIRVGWDMVHGVSCPITVSLSSGPVQLSVYSSYETDRVSPIDTTVSWSWPDRADDHLTGPDLIALSDGLMAAHRLVARVEAALATS
jgi:hypothetical protein